MSVLRTVTLLSFSVFLVLARPHSLLILTVFSLVMMNTFGRTLVSSTSRVDVTPSASTCLQRRNLIFSTQSNMAASLRTSSTTPFPGFLTTMILASLRTLVAHTPLNSFPTLKSLVSSTVNLATSSC